jgi:hypothetical protein
MTRPINPVSPSRPAYTPVDRAASAVEIEAQANWQPYGAGRYSIPSRSRGDRFHVASADACTCEDFQYRVGRAFDADGVKIEACAHMLAVRLRLEKSQARVAATARAQQTVMRATGQLPTPDVLACATDVADGRVVAIFLRQHGSDGRCG